MNTQPVFLATADNVSIMFTKDENIQWFIDMALAKSSTLTIISMEAL